MFKSELCYKCDFEAHALAFHPSGLHIVVGFSDQVRMMNILDKTLVEYKKLPIKECREIVFSNGGHLFACQNDKDVWVYKFYTASIIQQFKFSMHTQPVKRISWLDDDTGFVTCG
jgi:WD40 repeat protein|mmetsp:Transcript_17140/g.23108  ORF Transcript_17140/g.23108 Transcript_17140/m.23108 type:complete len:115 (-) Transcript_17140:2523-2867(-)